jgi:KaiC/GvpD/RAD55 family RecA-like ATPase
LTEAQEIPPRERVTSLEKGIAALRRRGYGSEDAKEFALTFNSGFPTPWPAELVADTVSTIYEIPEDDHAAPPDRPSWPVAAEWLESLATLGEPIPTHLPALDLRLRGGMRTGRVCVIGGGPGAGKTSLLAQMARRMAASGASVVFWSGDEGPESIAIRIGQHVGIARERAERGEAEAIADLVRETATLRFLLPDPDKVRTLPQLFEGLAAFPEPRALFVDSLQKAFTPGERDATHEAIEDRMTAIRKLSARHRVIAFVASEIGRGSYSAGNGKAADLGAFKGSGGIEYGADVALVIRPEETEGDYRATIVKNRIGSSRGGFLLRLDGATCLFSEVAPEEAARVASEMAETARAARLEGLCGKILDLLSAHPGLSTEQVREALPGANDAKKDALALLQENGRIKGVPGPRRGMYWSLP